MKGGFFDFKRVRRRFRSPLATGAGSVDAASTKAWMDFMREWQLSHCNWGVFAKAETAAIIPPGAAVNGGWAVNELTESGRLAREWVRRWAENPPR